MHCQGLLHAALLYELSLRLEHHPQIKFYLPCDVVDVDAFRL
jgi:hypothetical protein